MAPTRTIAQFLALAGLGATLMPLTAHAAYPARDIVELAVQRYGLKLESDRSACAYYANPNTLQNLDDYRVLFVIRMVDRDAPGSLCNGVFETTGVRVKCATQEVSYGGLPLRPGEVWRKNPAVAQKVCAVRSPQPSSSLDRSFFDRVEQSYTLFVEQSSFEQGPGCSFYANPKTLTRRGNERSLSVLNRRGEGDGTICRSRFRFFNLSVRCQTGEVSYSERLGSPATWKETWQNKPEVAAKICRLDRQQRPLKPIPTQETRDIRENVQAVDRVKTSREQPGVAPLAHG